MKNLLKNLFFLFLVLASGLGLSFFRSQESDFLILFLSIIVFVFYKLQLSKSLGFAMLIWIIYFLLSTISVGSFHPYFMIRLPIHIFAAYILIRLYENEIIEKFEKTIYYLSIISLFFFIWQVLNPDSLYYLADKINFNEVDPDNYDRIKANLLVYTVNHFKDMDFPRNAGFCWEPGPYGCFIVIAIYFNMIRNHFNGNKIFWILLITLITTQSTTAIISFIILYSWVVLNNQYYSRLLLYIIPIVIVLFLLIIINTPILQEKIIEDFAQADETEQFITESESSGVSYAPGRFVSFQITWQDFIERPLLGYGGNTELQWTRQLGALIYPVSGIGNILANFGLFGFICWILVVLKSSTYIKDFAGNYRFRLIWLLLILSISIGFMIIISPIFLAFYLLPYFKNNETELLTN